MVAFIYIFGTTFPSLRREPCRSKEVTQRENVGGVLRGYFCLSNVVTGGLRAWLACFLGWGEGGWCETGEGKDMWKTESEKLNLKWCFPSPPFFLLLYEQHYWSGKSKLQWNHIEWRTWDAELKIRSVHGQYVKISVMAKEQVEFIVKLWDEWN